MLRTRSAMLAAVAICATIATAFAAPPPAKPIIQRAVEGFVRPAYASFHSSTNALQTSVAALCTTPSDAAMDAARKAFADTVQSWSKVEIIRFGPITEQNRLERVLFWPDRKGTGLKQVQAALAEKDASATDAASLAQKSVAMQGLGALEFVLFGAGAEVLASAGDPYRCAYGAAVAGNLDTIAADVEQAWKGNDGIVAAWVDSGATSPLYRDDSEALGELFDVFVNGLELVRDVRINSFLGRKAAADKPRQALFWRSQQTVPAIAGNLEGMQALFDAAGLQDATPDSAWLAQSIDAALGNGITTARSIDGPVDAALEDPAQRGKLDYVRLVTSTLSHLFGTRLSAEFGVTAGFSSLDGD